MSFLSQSIVGIDFHDYSAELVELKMKGNLISLEAFNRTLIATDVIRNGEIRKEESLKKSLLGLLKNSNPKPVETKNVAIVFPANKTLTHIFTFPASLNEKDIDKAIPYEAETVIPYSINDVYWDFMILEKDKEEKKHASQYVFFACITKEIADQYSNIIESIGLTPTIFGIHTEALKYALMKQMKPEEVSLVLDVNTLSVNYLIVKEGIIKYFFSTNTGGKRLICEIAKALQVTENAVFEKKERNKLKTIINIPQVKEFIEDNYKQAQKIIQEQQQNKVVGNIENIFLTGEFLNLPGFYDLAKIYFPNQKISVFDSKINLNVDEEKFEPLQGGKETSDPYSIYFTNAIGVCLKGLVEKSRKGINLLPDRIKESLTTKRNTLFIAIASISIAILSLIVGSFLFFKQQNLKFERVALETKKNSIENMIYGIRYQEIRDNINEFNTEINILSGIDNNLFSVASTIEEIESLLPRGIEISSIAFNDSDLSFEITGVADKRTDLLDAKKNLENAEFISEVIAPISNYDEKSKLSFLIKLKLDFTKLPKYGSDTNTN